MGYPARTGDPQKDLENLYDFVCELSDRLSFALNNEQVVNETEETE
jgi:hypothetical protein